MNNNLSRVTLLIGSLFFQHQALAALGDELAQVLVTADVPVGIEHDGNGNLYMTDVTPDSVSVVDPADGSVLSSFSVAANSSNPLGVTHANGIIYVTDTSDDDVDSYLTDGTYLGSFSVAAQTTFPEGISYNAISNTLVVTDGVASFFHEYRLDGTLVTTYASAPGTSSLDGLAYDPVHGGFWNYDSDSSTVTHYDCQFNAIESFTGAASGEGLAVIGDILYVMYSNTDTLISYDISEATTVPTCCPAAPLMGCETDNGAAKVSFKSNGKWKAAWLKGNVESLGNPGVATGYNVCLFVDGANITGWSAPAMGDWKAGGDTAKFKAKGAPLSSLIIKADPAKGKIVAKGDEGPALPLPASPKVQVQFSSIENGATVRCWDSSYEDGEIIKNDSSKFTGKHKK